VRLTRLVLALVASLWVLPTGVVLAGPLTVVQAPATTAAPPAPAPMPATGAAPSPAPATTPSLPIATVDVPAADPNAFPPMSFYASVAENELLGIVRAQPAFARLDKELLGSPVQVRVTHTLQPTAGGQAAGLLSAIWAGSTLGLLPVVTNNNLVLVYEVRVNGKEIARYDFQRSFTRAIGIWGAQNDPTYGLGTEGLEWAKGTASEFATKAAQDPALLALAKEWKFYFGEGG
jgi:hypothetical protein